MLGNDMVGDQFALSVPVNTVDIPNAFPVRLQRLDLARHSVAAPNGTRYVIATYDDTHISQGYITALYPQQNGYLTLLRLVMRELKSETPEQALERHVELAEAIQRGELSSFLASVS